MRHRTRLVLPTLALLAAGLAGCGDPESERATDNSPGPGADEVAAHHREPCPTRLPLGDDPGHGFGTSDPADLAPSLPAPEEAWVCLYSPMEDRRMQGGNGTRMEWVRADEPTPVGADMLDRLTASLEGLVPAEPERFCTAELGQRWMLAYSHGTDLTGVVVDDYGCKEVRLTDEPFATPPGEATKSGTVPGVLAAPEELLKQLKEAAGN